MGLFTEHCLMISWIFLISFMIGLSDCRVKLLPASVSI
jgi:hypothetical protein